MAVMLYGIVSTTRAKQIAQTGIVSEGLTTISPVTLKFGSNEVNYFFFNRKDAEEVEERTRRRAEASNRRKRVRIIRVTFDRKALPCQAAMECQKTSGADTLEDLAEYIFRSKGIPSYVWRLPNGMYMLVVYNSSKEPLVKGVFRQKKEKEPPKAEEKAQEQKPVEPVQKPVQTYGQLPTQQAETGTEEFVHQYCREISSLGYSTVLFLGFLLGMVVDMAADGEGLFKLICVMGMLGITGLLFLAWWLIAKARYYEKKGNR